MEPTLPRVLEYRRLTPQWRTGFGEFCRAIEAAGDTAYFSPHPFTAEVLDRLVLYSGRDLYYVAVEDAVVIGYGLLRGWDEGFAIPSLGIAIHPSVRSSGLGTSLMEFLHVAARRRQADRIRLRVHAGNLSAARLYRRLGYSFEPPTGDYLVGFKDLRRP